MIELKANEIDITSGGWCSCTCYFGSNDGRRWSHTAGMANLAACKNSCDWAANSTPGSFVVSYQCV